MPQNSSFTRFWISVTTSFSIVMAGAVYGDVVGWWEFTSIPVTVILSVIWLCSLTAVFSLAIYWVIGYFEIEMSEGYAEPEHQLESVKTLSDVSITKELDNWKLRNHGDARKQVEIAHTRALMHFSTYPDLQDRCPVVSETVRTGLRNQLDLRIVIADVMHTLIADVKAEDVDGHLTSVLGSRFGPDSRDLVKQWVDEVNEGRVNLFRHATGPDRHTLESAYSVAYDAFWNVMPIEESGLPSILRSLAVGNALAEMHCRVETVIAGTLSHAVKHAGLTARSLGDELSEHGAVNDLKIVSELTDEKLLALVNESPHPRNMIPSTLEDSKLRELPTGALLIALADHLQVMRTIGSLSEDRQIEENRRTKEIFHPVAIRMGLGQIARELDDLRFKQEFPERHRSAQDLMELRVGNAEALAQSLGDYLEREGINVEVSVQESQKFPVLLNGVEEEGGTYMPHLLVSVDKCEEIRDVYYHASLWGGSESNGGPIYMNRTRHYDSSSIDFTVDRGNSNVVKIQPRTFWQYQYDEHRLAFFDCFEQRVRETPEPAKLSDEAKAIVALIYLAARQMAERMLNPTNLTYWDILFRVLREALSAIGNDWQQFVSVGR